MNGPGTCISAEVVGARWPIDPKVRRTQIVLASDLMEDNVVSVSVAVPMRSAAPDLLWPIGYSLQQRRLYAETKMIKE